MENKKYKIGLQYGDPSHDGHGMYETDYYWSNYNIHEIQKAFDKIDNEHSINFDNTVCAEYGECTLSEDHKDLFTSIGLNIDKYIEEDGRYVHDFTGLYLAIAKLGLPDLHTEFIKEDAETISIGGYGLFEN